MRELDSSGSKAATARRNPRQSEFRNSKYIIREKIKIKNSFKMKETKAKLIAT
jgi:hypothetical protein